MSKPLIHCATYRVQTGKTEEAKKRIQGLVDLVEAGSRAAVVQVHPDAGSMESHLSVISEHLSSGEWLDVVGPSWLRVLPLHEAGFTRSNAGHSWSRRQP